MKADALYARYSSEKQSDGYSIETQLEAGRQQCAAGASILEYVDRAKSGCTIAGRVELLRLLSDAAGGRIGRVIVYKFDRLGRNQAETATIIQDLEDAGVKVLSATEGDDPLARGIHLVISEYYIRQLAERTRAGCKKAAEAGRIGGKVPFGYRRRQDGQLEADPARAPILQRIFRDYIGGVNGKALARALNAEGVPTVAGRDWHAATLVDILDNEVYIGRLIFNRRQFHRDRKSGRRISVMRPREEWMIQERPDLALVSAADFAAAQARRQRRADQGERRRVYALSGLIVCETCGSRFVAQTSHAKSGAYTYFGCGNRTSGGRCTNDFRPREDVLMAEVLRICSEKLLKLEAVEALKATILSQAADRLSENARQAKDLEREISETRRRLDTALESLLSARVAKDGMQDLWDSKTQALRLKLAELEQQRQGLTDLVQLDHARLGRLIEDRIDRHKAALAAVHRPELVRDTLRQIAGVITAKHSQRVSLTLNPAHLLAPAWTAKFSPPLPSEWAGRLYESAGLPVLVVEIDYEALRRAI